MKPVTRAATIKYQSSGEYNFDYSFAFKTDIEDILKTRGKKNLIYAKNRYDKIKKR